jgi:hypothetical protein
LLVVTIGFANDRLGRGGWYVAAAGGGPDSLCLVSLGHRPWNVIERATAVDLIDRHCVAFCMGGAVGRLVPRWVVLASEPHRVVLAVCGRISTK